MNQFYLFLILFFSIAFNTTSYGQEDCSDGLDNDGDGFIDCWDADCVFSPSCEDSPLRPSADCQTPPSELPEFGIELDWASEEATAHNLVNLSIGDIDRDGMPEVITTNRQQYTVFILNGADGSIEHQTSVSYSPYTETAIANLDDDNCGEIFIYGPDRDQYYLAAFDCELNTLWERQITGNPGVYGLADFDGDGQVELYMRDAIIDAKTGITLVETKAADQTAFHSTHGAPVAADILGTGQLQLVLGGEIYSVNLGNRTENSGTLTLERTMPETPEGGYYTKTSDAIEYSTTSIADYNLDGYLDVIATGALAQMEGITTVFFWDVQNNTVRYFNDADPDAFTAISCINESGYLYEYGWVNGTGRANIADLDGDGLMNISYLSGKYLYALNENFEQMWRVEVKEQTSGFTGCTVFDFNGDGSTEIVYRDEDYLYIINGDDGSINTQTRCVSRTSREYPVVADVDNDGETEICITCYTNDNPTKDEFCDFSNAQYSQVRVYKTSREPWVPSRSVWNQHAYFNVNVNDDLTIPTNQQKHHLLLSDAVDCFVGGANPRPLNTFLNQTPYFDERGCPVYASPDLDFIENSLVVEQPSCPDRDFTISFQVTNVGDIQLSGDVPISFYDGDPQQAGATYLGQTLVTLNDFGAGDVLTISDITVTGPGDEFTLYVVVNDNGTTLPTPISLPNTDIIECDYDNIVSVLVSPAPFALSVDKQNFIKCLDAVVPGNGYASAYRDNNGNQETADYDFYWFNDGSAIDINSPDYVGPIYNGLDTGNYYVFAVHKTAQCSSDTAEVRIDFEETTPQGDLFIDEVDITACFGDLGSLAARVEGGLDENEYDYEWYKGAASIPTVDPIFATSREISNLVPDVYKVLVIEKTTGCSLFGETTVDDLTEYGTISASAKDIDCSTDDSGEVSASVGGDTTSFTFYWYEGITAGATPVAFTGNRVGSLGTGDYTVFAVDNATGCSTDTATVQVNRTTPPEFGTESSPQTSCVEPNGTATVTGINADDYTIEWFEGGSTTGTLLSTNPTLEDRTPGTYTVMVTDPATMCSTIESITVIDSIFIPTLSATPYAQTVCQNDGTVPFDADGAISATLSDNEDPDGYTFVWTDDDGTIITQTSDSISNLTEGIYSVVATNNITGCTTNEITVVVEDLTPEINIELLDSSLPNDCDDVNGAITLEASTVDNDSIAGGVGFTFEWYNGIPTADSTAFLTQTSRFSSTANNLGSGNYTVTITDQSTGCSNSEVYALTFVDGPEIALDNVTNTTTCDPNNDGSITVILTAPENTVIDGETIDESYYELRLYEGALTIADTADYSPINSTIGIAGVTSYTFSGLEPGSYSIFAIEAIAPVADGNCDLVGAVVGIVEEGASDPIINGFTTNNFTCATSESGSAALANGQIAVALSGENGTDPAIYILDWYIGNSSSGDVLGSTGYGATSLTADSAYATGLPGGTYTLVATDIATLCSTEKSFELFDRPPPLAVEVATTNYYRCDFPTGSARVDSVWENGTALSITGDYTFKWFYTDNNGNEAEFTDSTANNINGLAPGTYYVEVTNTITDCNISRAEFEIEDETLDRPRVGLADFTNPTICIQPFDENRESELVAVVIENDSTFLDDSSIYSFQWFEGMDTNVPAFANTSTVSQQDYPNELTLIPETKDIATYTVMVTDTAGCTGTGTYTLELEEVPITLSTGSTPVTRCDINDGTVYAIVTSAPEDEAEDNYAYTWYWTEMDEDGIPVDKVEVGLEMDTLAAMDYVVVVEDGDNSYCQATDTVTVENDKITVDVIATVLQNNTNCVDSLANGIVSASVDGEIVGYTFLWEEVIDNTTTVQVGTGPQVGNLPNGTYRVIATDNISGCVDEARVEIVPDPIGNLPPSIRVLSDQVNCTPEENGYTGQLFAYVLESDSTENTQDYIFTWYEGNGVNGEPLEVSDGSGVYESPVLSDLPAGTYTVLAVNKYTGCAATTTGQIVDDLDIPEVTLEIGASNCNKENGYAFALVDNSTEIESITWYDENDNIITIGPRLEEVGEGTYFLNVTTVYGCSLDTSFVINSIINPYNGISRNGDGLNDYFEIACIEDFPNNIVTIFNRAGQKVYEIEGYSNEDATKRFDGVSNRGVSIMGNELPAGTYFYIIDKRNGEEKLPGYLELR